MRYTFSILLFIGALPLCAQSELEVEQTDSKYVLHDLRIGANLIRAGRTWIGSGVETQELQATLGVNKFEINVDFGTERNTINSDYQYVNEGSYIRFGIDRNFVKKRSNGNAISLGLRYARAGFEDELNFDFNGFNEPEEPQQLALSNSNLTSRWFELVLNLRGKIVSNLYTGFTLRWQFANQVSGEGELKTFDIPGFGDTKRENSTGFDYYLMWRIPFRK